MSFEHKEGYGSIHKNRKREEGSKQPEYRGSIMLGGVVYELAAWVKEGEKGKFFSLKGQLPREKDEGKPRPRQDRGRAEDIDSDVPF